MVDVPVRGDLARFRAQLVDDIRARRAAWRGGGEPRAASDNGRSCADGGVLVDGCAPDSIPAEYSVDGALERGFSESALRYFALTAPPVRPWVFSWTGLAAASCARETLNRHLEQLGSKPAGAAPLTPRAEVERQHFADALGEDLDTPAALEVLWNVVHSSLAPAERLALLLDLDSVLGLGLAESGAAGQLPAAARELVEARARARQQKDWARSDELRAQLAALGVETRDSPRGSEYLRAASTGDAR